MPVVFSGQQLRARRRAAGFSQEELARRAGVGRRTVINAEAGSRRTIPSVVQALAGALGVDVAELHHAVGIGAENHLQQPPNGGLVNDNEES